MDMQWIELAQKIEQRIQNDTRKTFVFQNAIDKTRNEFIMDQIREFTSGMDKEIQNRIESEFLRWGPIENLIADTQVTEIMINDFDQIWVEKFGILSRHPDRFATRLSFQNFLNRMLAEVKKGISMEHPVVEGVFQSFRLQVIGSELTTDSPKICLRRQSESPWTLNKLLDLQWSQPAGIQTLRDIVKQKRNFLVVGGTGSGKTSVLAAMSNELEQNERVVYIEDTSELKLTNSASLKLLTREDLNGTYRSFSQSDLIKSALRLRPDRIVMGEIRGPEAKDFLMALSTGHDGSFGSLHAQSAAQALLRLEMLIQLGAPFWGLSAIRRLIQISLHYIIVVGRKSTGHRALQGIYKIASLEENGFTLDACYR
jgi:pilus assembly protein CpaF